MTSSGSVDIARFSFTHKPIAEEILAVAEKNRVAKFRLFFDHSMLFSGPDRRGLMPPYMEEKIKETLADYVSLEIQKVLDDCPLPASNIRNLAETGTGEFTKALEKLKTTNLVESYTKAGVECWRF